MAVSKAKLNKPNPWALGAQIAVASSCAHHTKYTCKTSKAETKNAAAHINKQ